MQPVTKASLPAEVGSEEAKVLLSQAKEFLAAIEKLLAVG
jgi:hypothetical protein